MKDLQQQSETIPKGEIGCVQCHHKDARGRKWLTGAESLDLEHHGLAIAQQSLSADATRVCPVCGSAFFKCFATENLLDIEDIPLELFQRLAIDPTTNDQRSERDVLIDFLTCWIVDLINPTIAIEIGGATRFLCKPGDPLTDYEVERNDRDAIVAFLGHALALSNPFSIETFVFSYFATFQGRFNSIEDAVRVLLEMGDLAWDDESDEDPDEVVSRLGLELVSSGALFTIPTGRGEIWVFDNREILREWKESQDLLLNPRDSSGQDRTIS